jgi:hypothetical protein
MFSFGKNNLDGKQNQNVSQFWLNQMDRFTFYFYLINQTLSIITHRKIKIEIFQLTGQSLDYHEV